MHNQVVWNMQYGSKECEIEKLSYLCKLWIKKIQNIKSFWKRNHIAVCQMLPDVNHLKVNSLVLLGRRRLSRPVCMMVDACLPKDFSNFLEHSPRKILNPGIRFNSNPRLLLFPRITHWYYSYSDDCDLLLLHLLLLCEMWISSLNIIETTSWTWPLAKSEDDLRKESV